MKFVVTGYIKRESIRNFALEVDAKNEKHAVSLALTKLGGAQGVPKSMIVVTGTKKA
jgi:ribosomal protein L20A (L18A)